MRSRHVPGPYLLAPEDIAAAEQLLAEALPLIGAILGFDRNTQNKLESLFRSDYEYLESALTKYLESAVSETKATRKTMTLSGLASGANLARSSMYEQVAELRLRLEECAVALTFLLAVRGDFCDSNLWIVCDFDSPVGRDAHGPGIHAQRQRLVSLAGAGGDMVVPALLSTPTEKMQMSELVQDEFAHCLASMAGVLKRVAQRVKAFGDADKLHAFGITLPQLAAHAPLSTLLVPEVRVGPVEHNDWPTPVRLGGAGAARLAQSRVFQHMIVESDDMPYGSSGWTLSEPSYLRRLAGLVSASGLDIPFRPSSVAYWRRNDGRALHRRQLDDPQLRAVATELSYVLTGFDLSAPRELARAIACIEFMATSPHIRLCGERFGEQMTPSLVKAHDGNQRGLLRALRATYNAALVAVGRERQADAFGDPSAA